MTLEKEKQTITELESKVSFKDWLIRALCPNKLANYIFDSKYWEERKPSIEEAVKMLRYPEFGSLHVVHLCDDENDKEREAIIMEPLTRFGKKDLELLEIIIAKSGKYHLKLFDKNNLLIWEEIRST